MDAKPEIGQNGERKRKAFPVLATVIGVLRQAPRLLRFLISNDGRPVLLVPGGTTLKSRRGEGVVLRNEIPYNGNCCSSATEANDVTHAVALLSRLKDMRVRDKI